MSTSQGGDVAFTIVVNRQGEDDTDDKSQLDQEEREDANRMEVDFMQEAVQEAITEAVQDAVQEVCYEPLCIEKHPDKPQHIAGFLAGSYQLACKHIAVSLMALFTQPEIHISCICSICYCSSVW